MSLVQLSKRRASVNKLPRAEEPVFEFDLDDNQQIIAVASQWDSDWGHNHERKTIDHTVTVWVATRL